MNAARTNTTTVAKSSKKEGTFIPAKKRTKQSQTEKKKTEDPFIPKKQIFNKEPKPELKETQKKNRKNTIPQKEAKKQSKTIDTSIKEKSAGSSKVIQLNTVPRSASHASTPNVAPPKEKKKKDAEGEKEKTPRKITRTNTNPKKDKKFLATLNHVKKSATEQQTHKPASDKVTEVEKAAKLPESDQTKKNDQRQHIGAMDAVAEKSKEKPFTASTFKALLKENLTQLENDLPRDEDSAEDFKRDKPIDKIKENISGQVKDENKKLSGPMAAEIKKKDPPSSGLPTEKEEKLPFDPIGKVPKAINAKAAVPKKKHSSEISMEDESASIDDYKAENEITDEQLVKSNEPKFTTALQTSNEAKQKAAEAPKKYRGKERAILNNAQGKAANQGSKGLQGMYTGRVGSFVTVAVNQVSKELSDEQQQKVIYKKLEGIYNKTKTDVETKLKDLSDGVDTYFSTEAESAKKTFEKNVEKKLGDIYGFFTIDDKIFGEDTEAIEKVFQEEKKRFITKMDSVLDKIATLIAKELNAAIALINKGRKDSEDFFNTLSEDQKKLATDALDQFKGQYDSLEETVREKEQELAKELATSYKENVDSLRESFDSIKESVSATWIEAALNALKAVVEAIIAIKNLFVNLLVAVVEAIGAIIQDPIGFLSNLISGIKQGFENFGANIKKHLITGLIEWLTGSLGGVGITLPENLFSLSGIFDLSMQIMGLTWDYFRAKAVKHIGEPVVQALETGFEMFQIIREKGINGLWDYIKESFTDLKETVMDGIRDMIITKVVEAGIKWVLGLMSPAGAFVKAAMMIIDIVKFFVERASQIFELVTAFTNSIKQLAAGNVAGVAKGIEMALAKALPVMIGFLASLSGITGLTGKVQKIIKKIRKRIDKAIDKLISKAKKWGKKLFSKKKGKKNKKQKNKDIASGKLKDTEVGKVVTFKSGKESHKQWIDTSGKGVEVMMASTPGPLDKKIDSWKKKTAKIDDVAKKNEKLGLITKVETLRGELDRDGEKVEKILEQAQKKPESQKVIKDAEKGDDALESKQDKLKRILIQLLDELDNLFEIPQKVRKHISQRVVAKTGDPRFLAGFKSDTSGTDYTAVVRNKDNDAKPTTFIIQRTSEAVKKNAPQLFINDGVLEMGKEREYVPDHKNYVPSELTIAQNSDGNYIATYKTKTHDGQAGPDLEVAMSFTEALEGIPNKVQKRTVKAEGLKFKPEGNVRGQTDSAVSGFHNAHLIGDRFGGSGRNEALNIYPSSEKYNVGQSFMLGKEDKMAEFLAPLGEDHRYKMNVTAHIDEEIQNAKNLEALLKKEFGKDTRADKDIKLLDNKLIDDAEQRLTKALRSEISKDIKDVPGQFLKMQYMIDGKDWGGFGEDTDYEALVKKLGFEKTNDGTKVVYKKK
ncbi:hypothetical protein [Aquimarina sp. RZ0]|uniref:hypothetical protein n=1 Tax=Aquimarina sp. RZ0 TaxID=2607730 RepID=UPI0011F0B65C|nr:hypothetical protein [Aquimarina sp. RZ0]KAA1248048.1 hypothetical protein F0000_00185 [Aquimarina sp. RZ0]